MSEEEINNLAEKHCNEVLCNAHEKCHEVIKCRDWRSRRAGFFCGYEQAIKDMQQENKRLEGQISILLSCKDCPENKGGYICEKEYNDKCLSQKIQYIKELKEELEKMTSVADHQQSCNMKKHFKLEQAKEIIKSLLKLVDPIYKQCEEYYKMLEQAEQFLEESK